MVLSQKVDAGGVDWEQHQLMERDIADSDEGDEW